MYGLLDRDFEYMKKAINHLPEIERVFLYGSRAIGNYKNGSDIDLAIAGEGVTDETIARLNDYLNETYPLPYMFDLVHYETISNQELKKHIDTHGKELWKNGAMVRE
ncbi:nucleotidyltransferase family protein [Salimicrobium halophilum]|uniref:Predicted nucleotidyltransferase n=1 Tax=Salimicrobium halophilum TaxID=86666 RepID=A0A1G8R5M2_9BACI|nr:nucleotidyltransferase domain-containing protein [Salimicrobium halophilum]SDJ12272.1 Predicted nucleotidyltransferase [Salimicrobium halophilum]